MADAKSSIVALNDVSQLLTAIRSGELRAQLSLLGAFAADCDVRCGCNSRDCGCHGSVSSSLIDEVSFPEFERMRKDRIEVLKAQLARLQEKD